MEVPTASWEIVDQLHRHRDVRRFLFILALDPHTPPGDARAQQQRGSELGAMFDTYPALTGPRAGPVHGGRQFVIQGFDAIAKLTQRREKRCLWAFMHPRHAVQAIGPAAKADERAQEASG